MAHRPGAHPHSGDAPPRPAIWQLGGTISPGLITHDRTVHKACAPPIVRTVGPACAAASAGFAGPAPSRGWTDSDAMRPPPAGGAPHGCMGTAGLTRECRAPEVPAGMDSRTTVAPSNARRPKCPYDGCPGVYGECGGQLLYYPKCEGQPRAFWMCSRWGECSFRLFEGTAEEKPILSLEFVSDNTFVVVPAPGAEDAVQAHGGLSHILKQAGLNMTNCRPIAALNAAGRSQGSTQVTGDDGQNLRFRIEDYEKLKRVLWKSKMALTQKGSFPTEAIVQSFRSIKKGLQDDVEHLYSKLPKWLEAMLLPFQREGVRFGLRCRGRCLIGDEMGVGKTLQAIALTSCYKDEWPLLVVAPASLRLVWAEELEKWLPFLRPSQIHLIEGSKDAVHPDALPLITITSYEMLKRLTCKGCCDGLSFGHRGTKCAGPQQCMAAMGFKVVAVDESHTLRTTNSRGHDAPYTEAAVAVLRRAMRVVLLTGTPSLRRPFDLYRQIDALRPGLLGKNKEQFAFRYCARRLVPSLDESSKRWDNSGGCRLQELHHVLMREVMIRRLKRDILSQLPPKRRQVVRLPRPPADRWPNEKGSRNRGLESQTDSSEDRSDNEALTNRDEHRLTIEHRTGLAKLPDVVDWLMNTLGLRKKAPKEEPSQDHGQPIANGPTALLACPSQANAPKVLVFAHHRDVMDGLAAALEGLSCGSSTSDCGDGQAIGYVRVDGECLASERLEAVRRFSNNPEIRVALLSLTAAGVGLDFSAANVVVFAELPNEVALVRQAEDRAHRRGQANCVNVYFMCSKGTSDDHKWQHLCRSLDRITLLLDGSNGEGNVGDCLSDSHLNPTAQNSHMQGIHLDSVCEIENANRKSRLLGSDNVAAMTRAGALAGNVKESAPKPHLPNSALVIDIPMTDASQQTEVQHTTETNLELKIAGSSGSRCQGGDMSLWFEVGKATGRVHFHLEQDGTQPLGLSIPVEALTIENSPQLQKLVKKLLHASSGEPEYVMGPFGMHCSGARLSQLGADAAIQQAKEFAQEWKELRSVYKAKLYGKVLSTDLKAEIDAVEAEAHSCGAFGSSTSRWFGPTNCSLPDGASWRTVRVKVHGALNSKTCQQAFDANGGRLCLNCVKPIRDRCVPPEAELPSAMFLFCSGQCEVDFSVKSSVRGMRRELFKLERGVCQMCRLDCHGLVKTLQLISLHSREWRQRRGAVIRQRAPKLALPKYKAHFNKLVTQSIAGNAWHADHIVPVYKGGGNCTLVNMRTLCVGCHSDVTREQVKERKAQRDRERLNGEDFCSLFKKEEAPTGRVKDPSVNVANETSAPTKRRKLYKGNGNGVELIDFL
eukprot:evm.model.scf_153.2 EVM.evm.TU.scf_153.2   scf_153:8261-20215(-)